MIARVWGARMTRANAAKYREHFETQVLPTLRMITGYVGGELLNSLGADDVEIVVTTRWHSMEAIRAFAGADLEKAVVAEEVKSLFTHWDRRVRHYEMLVDAVEPDIERWNALLDPEA